jgi:hypothetical protein
MSFLNETQSSAAAMATVEEPGLLDVSIGNRLDAVGKPLYSLNFMHREEYVSVTVAMSRRNLTLLSPTP